MRRPSAAIAALALLLGVALARPAGAGDAPPVPAAPGGPAAPRGPAPAAPAKAAPAKMTADELEKRLFEHPGAAVAMAGLKYGTALAGLVVLVLLLVRRRDERRGLAPARRPSAPPPRPFSIWSGLVLAAVAMAGGGLVGGFAYVALRDTGPTDGSMPLEWHIGSTAAGSIPVAIVIAFAIHRAWARRRAGDASEVAEAVFGDGTVRPSASATSSPAFAALPTVAWPARAAFRAGIGGFCVASLLVLVVSALTVVAMNMLGMPAEPQDLVLRVVEPKAAYEPWLIAGFGVLVAPVTEEYVFRGMLYPAFRDGSSPLVGALVSSVIFGAIHASYTAGPALFVLAFLLCRLYERTGSVWPGILVHALNNATSLLPLFLLR